MNQEYGFSLIQVRKVDVYFTVESSCTQQGAVEHIHTVGGCQDNDTAVCSESVHLGKQGVERVLAFIITSHGWIFAAGTSYSINLVDEDDGRRFLLSLTEEIAHT